MSETPAGTHRLRGREVYEGREHRKAVAAARTQFVKALYRHAPGVVDELSGAPLAACRPVWERSERERLELGDDVAQC